VCLTNSRSDAEHDVADLLSHLDIPVGLDDLLQPIAPVDERPERPGLEQLANTRARAGGQRWLAGMDGDDPAADAAGAGVAR
jgi:hypothetical protein